MAEPRTRPTTADPAALLAALAPAQRRSDAEAIADLLGQISGCPPVLWGTSIIGFGQYPAATGPWPRLGYSPRKANHVLYLMDGFDGQADLLGALGKATTGVSCLYVKRLADIDRHVLAEIVRRSWAMMAVRYPD